MEGELDRLEPALRGRYRIERELGRGGMATVYLAEDLKYGRAVALKALHFEIKALIAPKRFEREIRLVARLQHPHILTVFDSGEAEGILWFTMPFVEGENLRTRLERAGPMPLRDAVRVACEAASALQYAHDHGVVHRDIKPDNLLITADGITLVADFGIACAFSEGADARSGALTQTGTAIGTPQYMSPEQVYSDPALDARTDTYSLGAVVFEMLVGTPPFDGPNAHAVLARRYSNPKPITVRETRPEVPEAVDAAIRRALADNPDQRFLKISDFAAELDKASRSIGAAATSAGEASPRTWPRRAALIAGLGIAVTTGLLATLPRGESSENAAATGRVQLAVLPFENLGTPKAEYFADGLTRDVRGRIVEIHSFDVIDWGSAQQYRRSKKTAQQIGRELGVRYVLTGRIQWDNTTGGTTRVHVSPELLDVTTGGVKWQQPFDAPLTDLFAVQADIAGKVASALNIVLNRQDSAQLYRRPTSQLAAYEAYQRGETIFAAGESAPSELRKAKAAYEEAVKIDPDYADAWARLGMAASLLYANGVPTRELANASSRAAERAIALTPTRPDGYLAAAQHHQLVSHDLEQAYANVNRAKALGARNVGVLTLSSQLELARGDVAKARADAEMIRTLDPRSPNAFSTLAYILLLLHEFPEARTAAKQGRTLAPASTSFLLWEAMSHLGEGNLAAAQAVTHSGGNFVDPTTVAAFFAFANDLYWILDEAQQKTVVSLSADAFNGDRAAWALALCEIHALLGNAARSRAYADTASISIREHLNGAPDDPQLHALNGVALAYAQRPGAVAAAEKAVSLARPSKEPVSEAYFLHQLARVYLMTGNTPKAVSVVKEILAKPYFLTPKWLTIDPTFAPIRGDASFQAITRLQ